MLRLVLVAALVGGACGQSWNDALALAGSGVTTPECDTTEPQCRMGASVAIHGTWLAAGAPYQKLTQSRIGNDRANAGEVFLWTLSSAGVATYYASVYSTTAPLENMYFGTAVGIDAGNGYMAVGAPGDVYQPSSASSFTSGAVHFFELSSSGASPLSGGSQYIGSNAQADELMGSSVAVSGLTTIVGAPGHANSAGTAYVFIYTPGNTPPVACSHALSATNPAEGARFGTAVAIDGDLVVIGSPNLEVGGETAAGGAQVFERIASSSNAAWYQKAELNDQSVAANEQFGLAVAVSGSTILVGCPYCDHNGNADCGSADVYVYDFSTNTATFQATLQDEVSRQAANDYLGFSVALEDENTAVVGGYGDDTNLGALYVFSRSGTTWTLFEKLTKTGQSALYIGQRVAATKGYYVSGGPQAQGNGAATYGGNVWFGPSVATDAPTGAPTSASAGTTTAPSAAPTPAPTAKPVTGAPTYAPTVSLLTALSLKYTSDDVEIALTPAFRAVELNYGPIALRSSSASTEDVTLTFTCASTVTVAYRNSGTGQTFVSAAATTTTAGPISIPLNQQTTLQLTVTQSSATRLYTISLTRSTSPCTDAELSAWQNSDECVQSCTSDYAYVTQTRTVTSGSGCSAKLSQLVSVYCGRKSCPNIEVVTVSMSLTGISVYEFTTLCTLDAFQATVSTITDLPPGDVEVTGVSDTSTRRALGITVEYTLTVDSASVGSTAVSAISAAASDGSFATQYASDVEAYGAYFVYVVVSVLASSTLAISAADETDLSASESLYYSMIAFNATIAAGILLLWRLGAWNCWKKNSTDKQGESQGWSCWEEHPSEEINQFESPAAAPDEMLPSEEGDAAIELNSWFAPGQKPGPEAPALLSEPKGAAAAAVATGLVLDGSLHDVQQADQASWERALQSDLALALQTREERIRVSSLTPGSIVVHLELLAGEGGEPTADQLRDALLASVADASSLLYQGQITHAVKQEETLCMVSELSADAQKDVPQIVVPPTRKGLGHSQPEEPIEVQREKVKHAVMCSAPALDVVLQLTEADTHASETSRAWYPQQRYGLGERRKEEKADVELTYMDITWSCCLFLAVAGWLLLSCTWFPDQTSHVIQNVTVAMQCQAQSQAQLATARLLNDMIDTTERNVNMYMTPAGTQVMTWQGVSVYANDPLTTSTIYTDSLPAVMLGVLNSTTALQSIYAVIPDGASCSVFSAEWINDTITPLVGRMYDATGSSCWQAAYSSSSGYGLWTETTSTSGIGPLASTCSTITSQNWFSTACALGISSTNVAVTSISSGTLGTGVRYLQRGSQTTYPTFGAEISGLTLASHIQEGTPAKGVSYVVSTTGSETTLLASTDVSVASQLYASSGTVDPASVGGLTGSSASSLQSITSFQNWWSNSATVSSAQAAGLVQATCPSSSTSAYIAVEANKGIEISTSTPSSSLRRVSTSVTELELLTINALPGDEYVDFVVPLWTATICITVLVFTLAAMIAALPHVAFIGFFEKHQSFTEARNQEQNSLGSRIAIFCCEHRKPVRATLIGVIILCIVLIYLLWSVYLSENHKLAVDDFISQITKSANTAVTAQFEDSCKETRQAARIWNFTGRVISSTHLSAENMWTTPLMEDFYTNNGQQTLMFGTQTDGLAQGANGTTSGVRVLARPTAGGCLQTQTYDPATDTGASDSATYPDDCFYDPRYTTWYEFARQYSVPSGAPDPATFVSPLYSIGATNQLGTACAEAMYTDGDWDNSAALIGVWVTEFTVNAIGTSLLYLTDGLDGTLFISSADTTGSTDGYLLAAGGQSISGITLCSSSSDAYISDATTQIYSEYDHLFANVNGAVLVGHNVVSGVISSMSTSLCNVISLARGQLYAECDQTLDIMFICAILSISVAITISRFQFLHVYEKLFELQISYNYDASAEDEADEVEEQLHEMGQWARLKVLQLEESVRNSRVSAAFEAGTEANSSGGNLGSGSGSQTWFTGQQAEVDDETARQIHEARDGYMSLEDEVSEIMRVYAGDFLHDSSRNWDAMTRLMLIKLSDQLGPLRCLGDFLLWFYPCFQSTIYLCLLEFLLLLLIALEIVAELTYVSTNTQYSLQGIGIFLLGADMMFGVLYSIVRNQDAGQKGALSRDIVSTLFVVPALWLVLMIVFLCTDSPNDSVHLVTIYIYPLLLVSRNQRLWHSLRAFAFSFRAASSVMNVLLCLLLTSSGLALLMLQGMYQTGDYLTDIQYEDFYNSFMTMFIYLTSGENYAEATATAYSDNSWMWIFFVFCSLMGLFFITSLLIEAFSQSYYENKKVLQSAHYQRQLAFMLVMETWMRHSHLTCALHDCEQRHPADPGYDHYLKFCQGGMPFEVFLNLMIMQSHALSKGLGRYSKAFTRGLHWIESIRTDARALVKQVEAGTKGASLIHPLLDLCADMMFDGLYDRLQRLEACPPGDRAVPLAVRKQNLTISGMGAMPGADAGSTISKWRVLWLHGQSPTNTQLKHALDEVRSWNSECHDLELQSLVVKIYLHKWRFHSIFRHLNVSGSSRLTLLEFERLYQIGQMASELVDSAALRVDVDKLLVEDELDKLTASMHQGRGKISKDEVETDLKASQISLSATFPLTDAEETEVMKRFNDFDADLDGQIDFQELEEALEEICKADATIAYSAGEIHELIQKYDIDENESINLEEFKQLRHELKIPPLSEEDVALLWLTETHERLKRESFRHDTDFKDMTHQIVELTFYALTWLNLLCLALYYGGTSTTVLDYLMATFTLLGWIEVGIQMYCIGLAEFFLCRHEPQHQIRHYGTIFCLTVSLAGVICLWIAVSAQNWMAPNTARFFMGFSTLCVFTKSYTFSKMLQTLFAVANASASLILALVITGFLFAVAAHDMFGSKPVDEDKNAYFNTYSKSLSTMFRLFVGEAWHAVMYDTSAATVEVSNWFFVAYLVLMYLLFAQLFVGVIINLYTEVQGLKSQRLYNVLHELYSRFSVSEREAMKKSLLLLNRKLVYIHQALDIAEIETHESCSDQWDEIFDKIERERIQQQTLNKFRSTRGGSGPSRRISRRSSQRSTNSKGMAEHQLDEIDMYTDWVGEIVNSADEAQIHQLLDENPWLSQPGSVHDDSPEPVSMSKSVSGVGTSNGDGTNESKVPPSTGLDASSIAVNTTEAPVPEQEIRGWESSTKPEPPNHESLVPGLEQMSPHPPELEPMSPHPPLDPGNDHADLDQGTDLTFIRELTSSDQKAPGLEPVVSYIPDLQHAVVKSDELTLIEKEEAATNLRVTMFTKYSAVGIAVVTAVLITGLLIAVYYYSLKVVDEDKLKILCQAQSHAELVTDWLAEDTAYTAVRLADMYNRLTYTYADSGNYVSGTMLSTMMGIAYSNLPSVGTTGAIFAVWQTSAWVFSCEYHDNTLKARLYKSGACYETSYDAVAGLDASAWQATSYGPLGVTTCGDVPSQSWYTTARSLGSTATSATVNTVSSGYIGITYMKQQAKSTGADEAIVFGASMDGRQLSTYIQEGTPAKGVSYVVSTTGSETTLLASNDVSVASQLYASSGTVDPASVGGLTGSSASSLQSITSFQNWWSNSATVSSAQAAGLVQATCPSSSTSAYIAVEANKGIEIGTSTPSSSLRRVSTSVTELELLTINALPGNAYRSHYNSALWTGIALGILSMFCMVVLAWLPIRVLSDDLKLNWKTVRFVDGLWFVVLASAFASCILWLIVLSLNHKSAVTDFGDQVCSSITSAFGIKLASSSTIAQQAGQIWFHSSTARATTALDVMNKWTTLLMQDFYTYNGLETIMLGTQTDGLAQGATGTTSGVRVLSRATAGGCLQTQTYDSAADTVASDSATYPDDCYYDPRYTTWYVQGRTQTTAIDFTSTYDNSYIAAALKACTSTTGCTATGTNWITPPSAPTADMVGVGVWGNEWKIDSLLTELIILKDGFTGSLAITDTNAIVLIGSSGDTVEPALTCGDSYIESAAKLIDAATDYTWASAAGLYQGDTVVSASQISWAGNPSLAAGTFVALMSFDRSQLYELYYDTLATGFAVIAMSLLLLGVISNKLMRKAKLAIKAKLRSQDAMRLAFVESRKHPYLHDLEERLKGYIYSLEHSLSLKDTYRSELAELEGRFPSSTIHPESLNALVDPQEALERMAISFLVDTFGGRDVILHMVLLLTDSGFKIHLLFLFRLCHAPLYILIVNSIIIGLIVLQVAEINVLLPLWGTLVALLGVDMTITAAFFIIRSRGFNSSDIPDEYHIPWRIKGHLITALIYPLLWILAVAGQNYGISPYVWPLMLIARNEEMWPAFSIFVSALIAASGVAYLFFCLVLVLAALIGVLLHGQYSTDDYYTDYQYHDYFQSITTTFIFLSTGENYVEAVSTSLEISPFYGILFLVCSLVGLFFISSLMIEVFMDAYTRGKEGKYTLERRRIWAALTTTFIVWTQRQHDHHESSRKLSRSSQLFEDWTPHPPAMGASMFEVLMLTQQSQVGMFEVNTLMRRIFEMLDDEQENAEKKSKLKKKQSAFTPNARMIHKYHREFAALASLCCTLGDEEHLRDLQRNEWMEGVVKSPPQYCREGLHQMQLDRVLRQRYDEVELNEQPVTFESFQNTFMRTVMTKPAALFRQSGVQQDSPAELWEHAENAPNEYTAEHYRNEFEKAAKMVYMSESELNLVSVVSKLCRDISVPLSAASAGEEKLAEVCSASVRLSQWVQLEEDQLRRLSHQEFRPTDFIRSGNIDEQDERETMEALLDEMVHTMYGLKEKSVISRRVALLLKLVQLHKWRFRIIFQFLDTDNSKELSIVEFDRLFCLVKLSSRLAADPVLRSEGEVMRYQSEIKELEDLLEGTSRKVDRHTIQQELQAKRRGLFRMQEALFQARRSPISSQVYWAKSHSKTLAVLIELFGDGMLVQMLAWLNLAAVACYGITDSHDAVDITLMVFPSLFAAEIVIQLLIHFPWGKKELKWRERLVIGTEAYLMSMNKPEQHIGRQVSLAIVVVSLVGSILLTASRGNVTRLLAGCSVFLIITRNEDFARMLQTFVQAISACLALILLLMVVMLLFASASHDMFGSGPKDEAGVPYFDTYSRSLQTTFQLFVGEGWHNIMYVADYDTTEAARFWFIGYLFVVGMLYCELFIGVIITLYSDVAAISSPHVFSVLQPIFRDFSQTERDLLIKDMLELNRRTRVCNQLFEELTDQVAHRRIAEDELPNDTQEPDEPPDLDELMTRTSRLPIKRDMAAELPQLVAAQAEEMCKAVQDLFHAVEQTLLASLKKRNVPVDIVTSHGYVYVESESSFLDLELEAQQDDLGEELQTVLSDPDQTGAFLLAECEAAVRGWLDGLILRLCELAVQRFCFSDTDEDASPFARSSGPRRFPSAEEVMAEVIAEVERRPELSEVHRASTRLCNEVVNIGEVLFFDAAKEQDTSGLKRALVGGLHLRRDQPLVKSAEEMCGRMNAFGEALLRMSTWAY